jgi:hypothetical protein
MAPFLVRHPVLIHHWINARETALALVRSEPRADAAQRAEFQRALAALRDRVSHWRTDDARQAEAVRVLAQDLDALEGASDACLTAAVDPWDALYRFAEARLSLEGQEACAALLLEPHGALVDHLAETMAADETRDVAIDGAMTCGALAALLRDNYAWTRGTDFSDPAAIARFWYVSAEKLEPRLGERFEEDGAELEQPIAVARDVTSLADELGREAPDSPLADFLLQHPEWRHTVRRVQLTARYPYAEIRDNLTGAAMRPVDLLRGKLAFFGARNFDPRSDRWIRIALFAGEPLIEAIGAASHPEHVV